MKIAHQPMDGELDLSPRKELVKSVIASFLYRFMDFKVLRRFQVGLLRIAVQLESGIFHSYTLRKFLREHHHIDLGNYSYGRLSDLRAFPANTSIGRYTSIGSGVRIFQANHPMDWVSMHPFFYRTEYGYVEHEGISRGTLIIGHDVWIGANAIITPGCSKIGIGAVVAAGAVVTKDVPPYAVVIGNPAVIKRYRFSDDAIQSLLDSSWWDLSLSKLIDDVDIFRTPVSKSTLSRINLLNNEY